MGTLGSSPRDGLGALLLGTLLLSSTSCASAPAPTPPEPLGLGVVQARTRTEPGALPGLSLGVAGEPDPAAQPVRCRLLALERRGEDALRPLARVIELLADLSGRRALPPAPAHTVGASWESGDAARTWLASLEGGAAGRVRELLDEELLLRPGASRWVEVVGLETVEDPADWLDEFPDRGPIQRRVAVGVAWDPGGPRVGVQIDDLDPVVEARRRARLVENQDWIPTTPGPAYGESILREYVLLDLVLEPAVPLVLRLPTPFAGGQERAFVVVLERAPDTPVPGADPEEGEKLAGAEPPDRRADPKGDMRVTKLALDAFHGGGGRRALLVLAERTSAALTSDLALVATDEVLAEIAEASRAYFGDVERSTLDEREGWRLDRVAWRLLATRALEERLAPDLEGLLLRHAGALGRFPDVLLSAASASATQGAFDDWLQAEQFSLLTEITASHRIRAHEWLSERGLAVPGYDPLAPREERRAALAARAAALEEEGRP